jgi:ankyrin repeat protein
MSNLNVWLVLRGMTGADINKEVSWQNTGWFVTRESHTPLRLACKHAQVAVTQLLLERGADATKIDTFFSSTLRPPPTQL